jgi:hypothetical protein
MRSNSWFVAIASAVGLVGFVGLSDADGGPQPEIRSGAPRSQAFQTRPAGSRDISSAEFHKAFRDEYPYHVQSLFVSEGKTDRVLIVSEPPPHVSLAAIEAILGPTEVIKHRIGVDGWVKDVVARVPYQDAPLAPVVSRLSQLLFGTSYKAHVIQLPRAKPKRQNLDLRVNVAEIQAWTTGSAAEFVPVEGGGNRTVGQILGGKASRVYFSKKPGLVLWWIPKTVPLSTARAQSRQFALDSDLVIGGVATPRGVVVVGRERRVSVDELPPLRHETVQLLASARNPNLGQSYERQNPLAGRRNDVSDWAPIYLSPELLDTEYGSLLNITDQLLKSWSMAGMTQYENFKYPRPAPSEYPFREGLAAFLNRPPSVVFNWNTRGLGYSVKSGPNTYYALDRTGALPVSYFPEGLKAGNEKLVSQAETKGSNFFAKRSDPNLVRVVQYAALYQLFDNNRASVLKEKVSVRPNPRHKLAELLAGILKDSSTQDPDLRFAIAVCASIGSKAGLTPETLAKKVALAPSIEEIGLPADKKRLFSGGMQLIAQISGLPDKYAALASGGASWIHTPVVVYSTNSGTAAKSVGGHNLDSKVLRFELGDVPPGGARIKGNVVVVSRTDAPRLAAINRLLARSKNLSDIEFDTEFSRILKDPAPSVRQPWAALAGGGSVPPIPPRRGATFAIGDNPASGSGGQSGGARMLGWSVPNVQASSKKSQSTASLSVEMINGDYRVTLADGGRVVCRTPEDAADVVAISHRENPGARDSMLYMKNMDLREAKNFSESVQKRLKNESTAAELVGILGAAGWNPKLAESSPRFTASQPMRNTQNRFEIEVSTRLAGAQPIDVATRIEYGSQVTVGAATSLANRAKVRLDSSAAKVLRNGTTLEKFGAALQLEMRKLQKESDGSIESVFTRLIQGSQNKTFSIRLNREYAS